MGGAEDRDAAAETDGRTVHSSDDREWELDHAPNDAAGVSHAESALDRILHEVLEPLLEVAEDAVDAGVTIVPFSPRLDARATPILRIRWASACAACGSRSFSTYRSNGLSI